MKWGISVILLLLCTLFLQAQSNLTWIRTKEGKMVAVPKRMVFDLDLPKFVYKSFTPSNRQLIEAKLREFIPDFPVWSVYEQERPMDMTISSVAYQPFFNPYTPMLRRVSPMALDFHEVLIVPASEQVTFITSGRQYTWPGAGGLTRINVDLLWRHDRFSLSGGAFGGRYFTPFNPSPQFMGGFNTMASYDVADWLTVRGWGEYTFYDQKEKRNPHMLMNPFYNHTSVGGAFEFKVNDSGFKVGIGVNYEYNPIRGRMERQFLFYPAGKIGMFHIGN